MSNHSCESIGASCATAEAAAGEQGAGARRYLYLSFFFPPLGGPESRHNLSTVCTLAGHGFAPVIVCAPADIEYPKDEYLNTLVPHDVVICRFPWPRQAQAFTSRLRRLTKIPVNPLGLSGSGRIYRVASMAVEKHVPEFIYSVHGIGAVHVAARQLKRQTGLPWVAEFRDPWIHNQIIWSYMHDRSWKWWKHRELQRTRRFQEEILDGADLIVVESPVHAHLLISDFGLSDNHVVPFGLGYGEEYVVEPTASPITFTNRPVIGFVGSLYYGYDHVVEEFLLALRDLEHQGRAFTFVPVGSASAKLSALAREIGLRSMVPIERVSLVQALALMQKMDLGLVCVGPEYAANINSKMWEYLRMGLSILALVPDPGAMANIVKEGQCGYLLPYDRQGMEKALAGALDDYTNGCLRKAAAHFVARFSRGRVVAQLAERIEGILSAASRKAR